LTISLVRVIEMLELDEPALAAMLRSASSERLRRIGLTVADHMLVTVGLAEHVPVEHANTARLEVAREEATARYWELHGGDDAPGPAPGCLEAFARERALMAALAARGADPLEAAAEAVYEASSVLEDRSELLAILDSSP
jgi:hypothetical protein